MLQLKNHPLARRQFAQRSLNPLAQYLAIQFFPGIRKRPVVRNRSQHIDFISGLIHHHRLILDRGLKLLMARLPTFFLINVIIMSPLIVIQLVTPQLGEALLLQERRFQRSRMNRPRGGKNFRLIFRNELS